MAPPSPATPTHCVSSVKQAALTAAAAAAAAGWMRAAAACEHLSPSRRGFYLGAPLNIQQTIARPPARLSPPDAPHLDVYISESELGSGRTSLLHCAHTSDHHISFISPTTSVFLVSRWRRPNVAEEKASTLKNKKAKTNIANSKTDRQKHSSLDI